MLSLQFADNYSAGTEIGQQCRSIIEALEQFGIAHAASLPDAAKAELARFLGTRSARGIRNDQDVYHVMRAGTVVLPAFSSGFTHLLGGRQELIRLRSARSFELLQRILAVDVDVRKKWRDASTGKGETRCEQLGAVHLLSQGIYAFKIDARGARTDLVFGEPLDVVRAAQTSEGMVLTEWKVAHADNEIAAAFEEARRQVDLYKTGGSLQTRSARWAGTIWVSISRCRHGDECATRYHSATSPADGVVYQPINIAISPLTPSAQARRR